MKANPSFWRTWPGACAQFPSEYDKYALRVPRFFHRLTAGGNREVKAK